MTAEAPEQLITQDHSTTTSTPVTPRLFIDQKEEIDVDLVPLVVKNEVFHVTRRYNSAKLIGKGAFGMVIEAQDTLRNTKVAIKKCSKVFPTGITEQMIARQQNQSMSDTAHLKQTLAPKRVLREMKILAHLNHPNVINLKALIPPKSYRQFKDVYFVTELMESDLHNLLCSEQVLSDRHVQYLMSQICSAVAYIHSADIIHRDLKPENVLVNSNCELKICDFGLARGLLSENESDQSSEYVATGTEGYRAPEQILNYRALTKSIDMWAVGCIMAELFLNRKLFDGASPVAQLEQIVSLLGNPTLSDECSALQVIKRMKPCTRSFERVFQGKNPLAVDLLSKLLQFDPEKRITAVEALQHPFLQDVFEDSVQAAEKFDFSFETQVTDLIAIKREAFTTIVNFNSITFSNTTVAELRLDCFKERVLTPNAEVAQKELREIMHDVGEGSEKSPSKVKRGMLHWLGLWF